MRVLWQRWVEENPFFWRELRTRRRVPIGLPAAIRTLLFSLLTCGAVLIALQLLHVRLDAWSKPRLGALVFLALAVPHLILFRRYTSGGIALATESVAGRLDFLRLVPLSGPEFLFMLGVAGLARRILTTIVLFPAYITATIYGGISQAEVATGATLLLLYAWQTPAPIGPSPDGETEDDEHEGEGGGEGRDKIRGEAEVPTPAHVPGAALKGAVSAVGCLMNLAAAAILVAVLGQTLFRPLLSGVVRTSFQRAGAEWGPLFFLGLPQLLLRTLAEPQPIFGMRLPPIMAILLLRPLGVWMGFRQAVRVWRGDESELPRWERAVRRVHGLVACAIIVGFLLPTLGTGPLERLSGVTGPQGVLVALMGLIGIPAAVAAATMPRPNPGSETDWGTCLAVWLPPQVAAVALPALLGLVVGSPPDGRYLERALLQGMAALVLATVWLARTLSVDSEEAAHPLDVIWSCRHLLPALLLTPLAQFEAVRWAACFSPVTLWLRVLPGTIHQGHVPEVAACLAGAAIIALLYATFRFRVAPVVEREGPPRVLPIPRLDARVRPPLEAQDNPFLNHWLRRHRDSLGVTAGIRTATVAMAVVIVACCVFAAAGSQAVSWQGGLVLAPGRLSGLSRLAELILIVSCVAQVLTSLITPFALHDAVHSHERAQREAGLWTATFISGASDRDFVLGILIPKALLAATAVIGITAAHVGLLVSAIAAGVSPLWAVAGAGGMVAVAGSTACVGLLGFNGWCRERRRPDRRGPGDGIVAAACVTTALMVLVNPAIAIYLVTGVQNQHLAALALTAASLAEAAIFILLVRPLFAHAVESIRLVRSESDLEYDASE